MRRADTRVVVVALAALARAIERFFIVKHRSRARSTFSSTSVVFSRDTSEISEITRNILAHAGNGELVIEPLYENHRFGLVVEARDSGPGIRDIESVLGDGYTSRGGLGLGLPGARRLMDEFEIISTVGSGTTVRMTKWRIRDELELMRARRAVREADGRS